MNNYNNLINKPLVNGKELIGNISILSLPPATTSDVGKVPIVGEDGSWTLGTVSGGGGLNYNNNVIVNSNYEIEEV